MPLGVHTQPFLNFYTLINKAILLLLIVFYFKSTILYLKYDLNFIENLFKQASS